MIKDFQRILRNMPYTDMMLLASLLHKIIEQEGGPTQQSVAHALAALATELTPDRTDISKVEQDALRKVFVRDRAIKVRKLTNANGKAGWHVEVSGPYGASVVNEDLKTAIDSMLDTVAAAAALKG